MCEHQQNQVLIEALEARHVELFSSITCEEEITPEVRSEEAQLVDELEELEALFSQSYQKVQAALETYSNCI